MKKLQILLLLMIVGIAANAQGLVERYVRATEILQTNLHFIYQGTYTPVQDITYHEFSADSLTWRKNFQEGDCYIRFANTTTNSTNPHTGLTGYHDDWWVFNFCTCNGAIQEGGGSVDTIFVDYGTIIDTVLVQQMIKIPEPDTITGSTVNFQDTLTHTHELIIYIGDNEDVDTTGVTDGYVLKYNEITGNWEPHPDLIGGGASGQLTVSETDDSPSVENVVEIVVPNYHLEDLGAGKVYLDLTVDPDGGVNDYWRTDTVRVGSGDTNISFTALPDTDYILASLYAVLDNGNRQDLQYDSVAVDGFRVLSVIDSAWVHYIAIRNVDSLLTAFGNQGMIYPTPSSDTLRYLSQTVDDSTITVTNKELTVLESGLDVTEMSDVNGAPTSTGDILVWNNDSSHFDSDYSINDYVPDSIWNNINSAARLWGGIITDNSDGTVSIGAGAGIIKTDEAGPEDEPTALNEGQGSELTYVSWDAVTSLVLTNNAYNYIFLDGTDSTMKATTNFYSISFTQDFTVGRVYRTDNDVVVRLCGTNAWNFNRRVQLFGEEVFPIIRGTGLILGETGTRNITVTEGILWAELVNRFTVEAFDSSVAADTFTYWYYTGTAWVDSTGFNQIDNLNYNNIATGLATLNPNRYGVHWVYMVHDGNVHVVYGQGNYTENEAQIAPVPATIPGLLDAYATLIGKITIEQNATSFYEVVSAFTQVFETTQVNAHNDLSGLDGGEAGYYGHLTAVEKARVTNFADSVATNEIDPVYAADSATIVHDDRANTFTKIQIFDSTLIVQMLKQDVLTGTETGDITHNALNGNVGAYRVDNAGALVVNIHNLSSGVGGVIYLNIATNPSGITVNTFSDAGSTGLTEREFGIATSTAGKTTAISFDCVSDGTNTYVMLTYGESN